MQLEVKPRGITAAGQGRGMPLLHGSLNSRVCALVQLHEAATPCRNLEVT